MTDRVAYFKGMMLSYEKVQVVTCKNIWCKFEIDVIEFYEGTQMKTRSLIKGAFMFNIGSIWSILVIVTNRICLYYILSKW